MANSHRQGAALILCLVAPLQCHFPSYMGYMDKINKELKDWPFPNANGHFTIMRSSDPIPPDTIVDGIGYRRID